MCILVGKVLMQVGHTSNVDEVVVGNMPESGEFQIVPIMIDGCAYDGVFIWYDGCAYLGSVTHTYRLAEGWGPTDCFVEPLVDADGHVLAPAGWRTHVVRELPNAK